MKKIIFPQVLGLTFLLISSLSVVAQDKEQQTLYIKSAQFATPLIEKWAVEYAKVNPQVKVKLADSKVVSKDVALKLVTANSDENKKDQLSDNVLIFGQYAILPITAKSNPSLNELSSKRFNNKRLKELFFEKDIIEDDSKPSKLSSSVTIYSGNSEVSISHSFADYFGYTASSLRGKRISGDDAFLIKALERDNSGVTFNALSNIFDIKTRQLKDNIVILPLDVKKEYREYLAESANIDNLIKLLETQSVDIIPVESLGLAYNSENKLIKDFLAWVLSNGTQLNNAYGILNVDDKTLAEQHKKLEGRYYASTSIE